MTKIKKQKTCLSSTTKALHWSTNSEDNTSWIHFEHYDSLTWHKTRCDMTHDTIPLVVLLISITVTFSYRFIKASRVKGCSPSTLSSITQHKNLVRDQQTYRDYIAWEWGREWSQPVLSRYRPGGKTHQDVRANSHKTYSYSGFSGLQDLTLLIVLPWAHLIQYNSRGKKILQQTYFRVGNNPGVNSIQSTTIEQKSATT